MDEETCAILTDLVDYVKKEESKIKEFKEDSKQENEREPGEKLTLLEIKKDAIKRLEIYKLKQSE